MSLTSQFEAVSSGYGKEIACILTETASEDMIRKLEKFLMRIKIKKRRIARKHSATT
jgi:hypothetical protein